MEERLFIKRYNYNDITLKILFLSLGNGISHLQPLVLYDFLDGLVQEPSPRK